MHTEEGHKNDPRDRIPPCKGRLRELGMFSLEKRTLGGDQRVAFHCLKRGCKKEEDKLFSRFCCDRTRGSSFKLREEILRLDIRKKFFTIMVVRHWQRLPRERDGCPKPWTCSRSGWTGLRVPCFSCRCTCSLQESWTMWLLRVPSNSNNSMILSCKREATI